MTEERNTYDFTGRARKRMEDELQLLDPQEYDATGIYEYLKGLSSIPFYLYLKRWLYQEGKMTAEFDTVSDEVYLSIIREAFYETHTPFAFDGTVKKPSAVIRSWLTRKKVRRKTLFLLGFGLGMKEYEVSYFLQKAMGEGDFNFYSPEETLYWYCFRTGKNYTQMKVLEKASMEYTGSYRRDDFYKMVQSEPENYLFQEDILVEYIARLRSHAEEYRSRAYETFQMLYHKLGTCLGDLEGTDTSHLIENYFCSAFPHDNHGNLQSYMGSTLCDVFDHYRITRQRLQKLKTQQTAVDRKDLITLMFFLCCLRKKENTFTSSWFVIKCNEMMSYCRMHELYVCNPYEVFLILAMNTRYPLEVYSDIIELSYEDQRAEV